VTEVAVRERTELAPIVQESRDVAAARDISEIVGRWSADIESCAVLATRVVRTELTPASYWPLPPGVRINEMPAGNPRRRHPRESPEDYRDRLAVATETTAGSIYTGAQLGLPSWNAALQGIDYIRGRQSLRAELVESLYLSKGHALDMVERSATRACAVFTRRGGKPQELSFTWEQAVTAGYVKGLGPDKGKDRGNEKYHHIPHVMLWWRLMTDGVRVIAPEVLRGMSVDIDVLDEVRELPDITATVTDLQRPTLPAAALAAARQAAPVVAVQAPVAQVAVVDPPDERPPTERPCTAEQRTLIASTFASLGITGRGSVERRGRIVAALVREVDELKALTEAEAAFLLDNLTGEAVHRIEHPDEPQQQDEAPAGDPWTGQPDGDPWTGHEQAMTQQLAEPAGWAGAPGAEQ